MNPKERRGAKLLTTKKDGQQIEGELITVKPNSLLLLNTEGKDESIDIADIRIIRIVRESKAKQGAIMGGLVGGVGMGLYAGIVNIGEVHGFFASFIDCIIFFGPPGALIGALTGAAVSIDKTLQFERMTNSETQETLDKLRNKARIRDYKRDYK